MIMGQVLQAGAGQIPARQAAVGAGIPMTVPGADHQQGVPVRPRRDRAGRPADPGRRVRHRGGRRHGVDDQRAAPADRASAPGYKYGDVVIKDHMALDGLTDAWDCCSMGESTERHGSRLGHQPRGAGRVRRRAATSGPPPRRRTARFAEEIVPVEIPQRRATRSWSRGRGRPRRTPPPSRWPSCARRSPRTARSPPATSSPISDGAAAVVVMSKAKAEELGLTWLAEIGAHGNVAGPDNSLHAQPANAIKHALAQGGPDRRRPRPDRDQRGVRRGRHPVHAGARRRARTSSTSTAARSRSATRSACPAPGSR